MDVAVVCQLNDPEAQFTRETWKDWTFLTLPLLLFFPVLAALCLPLILLLV